jgi:integrase
MPTRTLHKLSAKRVQNERAPGRYADGGGLYLQVSPSATKSWLFRYTRAGVAREMGLGAVHTIDLVEARKRAATCRIQLLDGVDPIAARDAARAHGQIAAGRAKTFTQCAEAYIDAHRPEWKNSKHVGQWEKTLETYVYPLIGQKPVAAVDTDHIVQVLHPIWTKKNETALRLRGRIEAVLDWATVMKYRAEGLNPARWRGHLDHLLPRVSRVARIKHHAALPFDDVPAFMVKLRQQEGIAARALEYLILSVARTGEVLGMVWAEADLRRDVWAVPAGRMKAGREHRVPLVPRAVEILKDMQKIRDGEVVFPGRGREKPLSNMALLKTLERMGRDDITAHGFRSSFRDWASERTSFPREVIEMALAHAIGDKVEAAYRRGDLFEKRRQLMNAWAQFLERPPATVTTLEPKRRRATATK